IENCLASCGGGVVVQDGMIELLKAKGIIICLTASVKTILQRTQNFRTQRTLLQSENPRARIIDLLAAREPFYNRAGLCISTDARSIAEIVSQISKIYAREAKVFRDLRQAPV